ncbi:ABC-type transport auxiliary lipoprotein family protein [Bordetella genomosp. 9]|uniref:ABC-type transport auxiliary lipoprotein component domain-containing protein n=1 Tax=Bordetella genomosp. 9 TaxID=1416803 RepID=A0A1W6Z4Z4_9BORD|nr:ABC-type transport auxiliary lipoprotein family protein [Bordetella genomosp. 9]ARP88254.1 hypothetical protein CAL13_20090 [Bordetella genomosp. 9]ARP92218.1 hypothetical protein CAL14_19620 [Bordetella genomosp. 9]
MKTFGMCVAPLVLLLAGCGVGRTGAQAQLFDLGPPPAASAPASAQAREPVALSFSAPQMLTDTGVIWRVGDSASPHSYATYRWAASPLQLVQQRVADTLSASGPVVPESVDPRAPLLQVSLTRFEQVYAPDGKSSVGQVAMQAVLVRDRQIVDSIRIARSAPASTQDAQGGVLALRAATDAAATELGAWLSRSLSATSASAPATRGGLTLRSSP